MSVSLKVPFPSASGRRAWLRQGTNAAIFLKIALIGVFVFATNAEFWDRLEHFFDRALWLKLTAFLGIWGLALFAIFVAAFQPRLSVRLLWAAAITGSTAITWGYYHASGSQLSIYDVLSLWEARHEAGRAAEFYQSQLAVALIVAAAGMAVLSMPPGLPTLARRVRMGHLALFPILPVILIGASVVAKGGRASYATPSQFRALSLSAVAAETIVTLRTGERRPVAWTADAKAQIPHIVILMDESIRADYIDLTPGNPHTPNLAKLAGKFVDFGPAASGGICSNYSNALVRFGASRRDVATTMRSNPTLFRYAKAAGYRTVYIDAQANSHKDPGKRQNFMTAKEHADIDRFQTIQDVPFDRADYRLLEIVAEELRGAQSVFIYANKNGAHVPYDLSYPASEAVYGPTMRESAGLEGKTLLAVAGLRTIADGPAILASYRNAIDWSVDRFMERFFSAADLSNAVVAYTSDHAQVLDPGRAAHCVSENPDPRMALVPLLIHASEPALHERFAQGAAANRGKANHFLIAPTVLELMGYRPADIATAYDESLFKPTFREPAYTTGDVFGLFSEETDWHPIDLNRDFMEATGREMRPRRKHTILGAGSVSRIRLEP